MRHSVVLVAVSLGLSGCATLVHGPYQDVRISSDPPGATATISPSLSERGPLFLDPEKKRTVTTPATVRLQRDTSYRVEYTKPGYGLATTQIVASWDWFWGQLGCGPCEAVGQLPSLDLAEKPLPIRFLGSVFYEYPKGFVGAVGKAVRPITVEGWFGTPFKLKGKDAGYFTNWHAMGTPQVTATLQPQ